MIFLNLMNNFCEFFGQTFYENNLKEIQVRAGKKYFENKKLSVDCVLLENIWNAQKYNSGQHKYYLLTI